MPDNDLIELAPGLFVATGFADTFGSLGLTSIDSVFAYSGGSILSKPALSGFRCRMCIDLPDGRTVFLKRYDRPPIITQLRNWLSHRRIASTASFDTRPAADLAGAGIDTPQIVAHGWKWGSLFERRSFSITLKIPGDSLERHLPPFFESASTGDLKQRRAFIRTLADFSRRFHATGYRHRDFYLAHIFHDSGRFYLIDLQRAFKPVFFGRRFLIKDIAQLYYSAPRRHFSHTDRLRFFVCYRGIGHLNPADKKLIRAVLRKAAIIARHDRKHNRVVPYET